jgi:hypothetical protein
VAAVVRAKPLPLLWLDGANVAIPVRLSALRTNRFADVVNTTDPPVAAPEEVTSVVTASAGAGSPANDALVVTATRSFVMNGELETV